MFKIFAKKSTGVGARAIYQNIGQPIWTNRNYVQLAEESYIKNVIANRCVSIVAQSAASVPLLLKDKKNGCSIAKHPLLDLLNKPNPNSNRYSFFEAIYSHKMIAGNAYIQAICGDKENLKNPVELFILRPDRITIIAGNSSLPIGYRYKLNSQEKVFYLNPISGKCEILHLKNFNPTNDWYGLSQVEPAAYSIDQHNECSRWNQSMLQNGAKPSGALIVKSDNSSQGFLTDEQFERLKEQLNGEFSGSSNAGKPLLLEGGLEWKEMSLSPKDMDFINIKHSSARDIALSFGVPSQLIGIPGDNTYSNMSEARLFLWEQTILPMLDNLLSNLNSWLVPMFDDNLELDYNRDTISALSPRRELLWNAINQASFLNDDEKKSMLNLDQLKH